jgi:hypothetical protein
MLPVGTPGCGRCDPQETLHVDPPARAATHVRRRALARRGAAGARHWVRRALPVDFDALMQAHLARVFGERDADRRLGALEELYAGTPRSSSRTRRRRGARRSRTPSARSRRACRRGSCSPPPGRPWATTGSRACTGARVLRRPRGRDRDGRGPRGEREDQGPARLPRPGAALNRSRIWPARWEGARFPTARARIAARRGLDLREPESSVLLPGRPPPLEPSEGSSGDD